MTKITIEADNGEKLLLIVTDSRAAELLAVVMMNSHEDSKSVIGIEQFVNANLDFDPEEFGK